MNFTLGPQEAAMLSQKAISIGLAARELASFAEQDPGLAGECGVEINALEARNILAGGACQRLAGKCAEAARMGRQAQVDAGDIELLGRLEGVLALGSARMGLKIAAFDAMQSQEGMAKLGSIIGLTSGAVGLATGAVGLFKSIW